MMKFRTFIPWLLILLQHCNAASSFLAGRIASTRQSAGGGNHWKDGGEIAMNDQRVVILHHLSNSQNENLNESENYSNSDEVENDLNQEIKDRIASRGSLASPQGDGTNDANDSVIVPLPVTNTASQMISEQEEASFRKQERELLCELMQGDDAVAKLRQLWFSERGPDVEAQLYVAEACIGKGSPEGWAKAELILLDLVAEDPSFLEPFARLSKLYTLQGRFADSHQICLVLVEARPWHYVVLETMVVNTMVLEHNQDLKGWASKRLPPPSHSEKRSAWVKQAIADSIRLEVESSLMLEQLRSRRQGGENEEKEYDDLDIADPSRSNDAEPQAWQ